MSQMIQSTIKDTCLRLAEFTTIQFTYKGNKYRIHIIKPSIDKEADGQPVRLEPKVRLNKSSAINITSIHVTFSEDDGRILSVSFKMLHGRERIELDVNEVRVVDRDTNDAIELLAYLQKSRKGSLPTN